MSKKRSEPPLMETAMTRVPHPSSNKKLALTTTDSNEPGFGPWAGMDPDLLIAIFRKIDDFDAMIRVVPLVCTAWLNAVNRPDCWSHVDIAVWSKRFEVDTAMVDPVVLKVVQRSSGTLKSLVSFKMGYPGFSAACSSNCLRVLRMMETKVTDEMLENHIEALSKLTILDISYCRKITPKGIRVIGKYCKSLVEFRRVLYHPYNKEEVPEVDESEAMAIADSMQSIQHLELMCGNFSYQGVIAILSNCKSLRILDISGCHNLGEGDIRNKIGSFLRESVTLKTSNPWYGDSYEFSSDYESDSQGENGYDSSSGLEDVDPWDYFDDGYD